MQTTEHKLGLTLQNRTQIYDRRFDFEHVSSFKMLIRTQFFLRVAHRFRNTKFMQNRTQIMIDAPEPNTNLTIRDAEPNTILTLRDAVPDTGLWFAIRLRPRSEAVFETPVHDVPSWWLCVRRREQCRHVKLPYCIYHMNSRSISIVRYALNLFLSGGKRGKRG